MTSINTNIAAQTALRTLQSTNAQLDQTQSRISTGLKIAEAKDNAAYWSISTTLKSDNKAMGTVKDALGLGAATVDTAYQGLNAAKDVLDEIKSKLTAASQDGVDKTKIQAEIVELQKQLRSISGSSTFSGENWLSVSSARFGQTASVVSSFDRNGTSVTLGTIDITLSSVALMVEGSTTQGALTKVESVDVAGFAKAGATGAATAAMAFVDDVVTFNVTTADGGTKVVTLNKAVSDAAGTTGASGSAALEKLLNAAMAAAKVEGVTAKVDAAGAVTWSGQKDFTISAATVTAGGSADAGITAVNLGISASATVEGDPTTTAITGSVNALSLSGSTSKAEIEAYIEVVNRATNSVITAAANLGAVASRIELQQNFVSNLMDTIDEGVSGLIDADMNEESTRLQALQVKQQLGVQALSIANQSAQNVLRLFQ